MTTGRSDIEAEGSGAARLTGRAWGGPLSTWIRPAPSLGDALGWLRAQAEAQRDRWTLWTPVALGCGAAFYFEAPREPMAWMAWGTIALSLALLGLAALRRGPRGLTMALALCACAISGFGVAKLREQAVKAPVAPSDAPPQRVEGWVVDVASPGEGGPRLLIAPVRIGDWSPSATPIRVRVTLRDLADLPAPGQAVSLLALINPPPPPASPGAYDFARDAYFESVGGVGLALGPPAAAMDLAPPPWRLRAAMRINAARWALTRRIVELIGAEQGGLAAAMTTGHEAFIPKAQVDNLRIAGLAHIISISGVHMAIVGGFAFGGARLAVAAWPWLALRVNGKKAAALVGLAAVGGYLVLSGWPAPAQRAAITATVAFAAILADRQAISLHSLALAAMAVLLLQPEAVTEPGFQMSFAATAALVAMAEAWRAPPREINTPWPIRMVQTAWTWFWLSLAVSFVAGLATGPFAMQHFNRVSSWGLVTNLLVEPISSFLMMPALAVGALLTPFHIGHLPLQAAGLAIGLMNRVAAIAAAAPHAQFIVASGPDWILPVVFLGLLWLCLWRGALRWLGLPFACALLIVPRPPPPALWVGADGAAVAVRSGDRAVLLRPEVKRFGAELWARRRGLEPAADDVLLKQQFSCDHWSCLATAAAPVRLGAAWNLKRPLEPGRLEALCAQAEVVVLRNNFSPQSCPAPLVLTGRDFARGGSAELYRRPAGGWRIVWAQDLRGRRPWTWGVDDRP